MRTLKSILSLLVLCAFIFTSCKQNLSEDLQKVEDQKKAYEAAPSKQTAASYIAAVSLYSGLHGGEIETKSLLLDAIDVAKKEGQNMVSAGLSNEVIKQFPKDPENKTRLRDLAKSMQALGKKEAAATLNYFISKKHPEFAAESGIVLPNNMPEDTEEFIKLKAEKIFGTEDANGLDRNASFEYVDAVEAYAMVFPDSENASRYLFNAAEVSKTIGTFKKSLSLYDWIITKFPDDKNVPTAMFLKAFILEDNMKNIDAAKEAYETFIEKYPAHHFADDAQFSLNNLGKSDAEIQQELERLQKQNANK